MHVAVRSADEATLANQIIQEGSQLARRRLLRREPAGARRRSPSASCSAPVPAATLKVVPRGDSSPQRDPGSASRPARRCSSTTRSKLKPRRRCRARCSTSPSPSGRARSRSRRARPTSSRCVTSIAQLRGKAAAVAWLKALKRNAKVYDDNELIVAAVNKGEVATGLVDHYYWYRLRDEVGPSNTHSALHYFAPRDPGMLVDVSGAAILQLEQARSRRQALPRLPGQQAGADDHRHLRELRVPARLGRHDDEGRAPARRPRPGDASARRSSATARPRSRCCSRSGCSSP